MDGCCVCVGVKKKAGLVVYKRCWVVKLGFIENMEGVKHRAVDCKRRKENDEQREKRQRPRDDGRNVMNSQQRRPQDSDRRRRENERDDERKEGMRTRDERTGEHLPKER